MRSARAGSIGLHVRWAWGGAISSLFDKYFRVLTLDVVFLVCLTPNQLKVTKMTPKLVPRESQNPLKIKENPGLDSQVTSGVSPRTPGSPNLSPRVPKWSLQASQMTTLGTKTDPIQQAPSPACPANPASLSSHQLTD